jgi:hypothetical protein
MHRLVKSRGSATSLQEWCEASGAIRFFPLLPLPDVGGALEEITYALDILHLDGLASSYSARYLVDP